MPHDYDEAGCQLHYVFMGVGIGAGGSLVVMLICILIGYCALRCKGYQLRKIVKKPLQPTSTSSSKPAASLTPDGYTCNQEDASVSTVGSEFLAPDKVSVRNEYAHT